mgnify:CR=1 FL=1
MPYDDQQGWEKTAEGQLEPKWAWGPVLPPSLIELLERDNNADGDDAEFEEVNQSVYYDGDSNDDDI